MIPIRALVLQDPLHHHDATGGHAIVSALRSGGIDATLSESVPDVMSLAANGFNLLAIYTQNDTFDAQQVSAMRSFASDGNGILGIHSATATNKKDDDYAKLIGARFIGHGPVVEFAVTVSNPDHPIVKGISDFRVTDELYRLKAFDDFDVFLTTVSDGQQHPLGYIKPEGRGRVVYLANGHDLARSTIPPCAN